MGKVVGIIGGMGPLATADLFYKIVQATPASVDQDHLRIIIDNHPQIPSRVKAIMGVGESPLPKILESARLLEKAGVDFIVMPCNTAHYWYDDLQAAVGIPVFNMITSAAEYLAEHYAGLEGRLLLLATSATVKTGLFQAAFQALGMELEVPNPEEQELIERSVENVKAGAVAENPCLNQLRSILNCHVAAGTTAVLAGCTEIPLLFPFLENNVKKFDATMILAEKVVREATNH